MGDRFEFDPTLVVASMEVFPKQEYELQVGEPKSFIRKAGQDQHDSFGVRYPLVIKLPDEYNGKRTLFSTYYQSEGSQAMAKQFMMAALGYGKGKQEEERFDRDMRGKDWGFDPATGAVGDAYRELTGKRVIGSLDVGKNENTGDPMQQFKGWRPISSGPIASGNANPPALATA
jgi:hypothetical protein